MKTKKTAVKKCRIIAMLSRKQLEFMDKLSVDALFSTGRKLSRVGIVSALINVAIKTNLSAQDVHNEKELTERLLTSVTQGGERRKYPRIKEHLSVGFRAMDSMAALEKGNTADVSLGGFRIEVAFAGKPLRAGEVVEITIGPSKESPDPLNAIGRIVWVREKEDRHSYEMGVMLTYMNPEDRMRFLENLKNEI